MKKLILILALLMPWMIIGYNIYTSSSPKISLLATSGTVNESREVVFETNIVTYGNVTYSNTFWDDLRFPIEGLQRTGTSTDPDVIYNSGPSGNMMAILYDAANDQYTYGRAQLPHSRKNGTYVHPHMHWRPITTSTGDVCWFVTYSWANINSNFPTTVTITWTSSVENVQWKHIYSEPENEDYLIPPGGVEGSAMIEMIIGRDANNSGDTFPDDVDGLEFDMHIEIDKPGSREEMPE